MKSSANTSTVNLTPFQKVVGDFGAGKPVIIVDRADRENEGDITIATEALTPDLVALMLREARGLICVSISKERALELNLPLQVLNNNSPYQTPFAVSVDHRSVGDDGVTARGRCTTMRSLVELQSTAADFVSPGHTFPLIAHSAGVLGRQGQTEGSYDLARIAGYLPSGVICEILNPDGSMARGAQIDAFANRLGLSVTSVEEIIRYRISSEVVVREVADSRLKTDYGTFRVRVFLDESDGKEHLVLSYGEDQMLLADNGVLARIHSECLTGDVFGSLRCDCGPQLQSAMQKIVRAGSGIILYLRQEGRGIGLLNKLKAYALQDGGADTVEANLSLGFAADARDFTVAARIFSLLGIESVRLITNNPQKVTTMQALGITVTERIPSIVPSTEYSKEYLATKREKLGHML